MWFAGKIAAAVGLRMWIELSRALALVLVIEGLGPFLLPARWRVTMLRLARLDERSLRIVGLVSIGLGVFALQLLKS